MSVLIGLTGGIGSGKSTVAGLFNQKGIPVYNADEAGRQLTDSSELLQQISTIFGDSFISNKQLDRKKMATLVFNQPEELKKLNAIVHPAVQHHFENWTKQHQESPFLIKESAILFESGSYKQCALIINVEAPVATRIERVMKRDNCSREEVEARMNNQWTEAQRLKRSNYTITNTSLFETEQQVDTILKILNNL